MRDALGNRITDKSILCWHPPAFGGVVCQVAHVSDGGLALGDSQGFTPPMLVIQVMIPVDGVREGHEPTLPQFMCLVNPQAEAAIEGILAGQRKQ